MDDEQAVTDAVLKFVVLALVVGAVLGLVTFAAVKVLGVTGGKDSKAADPAASATPSALPTVALSSPGSKASASAEPSDSPSASATPAGELMLNANPGQVAPGQRINLDGSYSGQDNVTLQVQRMDNGTWAQFATVTVPVRGGSFATYIITSRTGAQMFRVYDVAADKGSNTVTVTVGG